jgi:hypothetical protein
VDSRAPPEKQINGCPVPQGRIGRYKFIDNSVIQIQRQKSRRDGGATNINGAQLKLAAAKSKPSLRSFPGELVLIARSPLLPLVLSVFICVHPW